MTNKSIRDYINLIENAQQPIEEAGDGTFNIKRFSGKPENYTFSKVQQKNYDILVDILARNGMKFTKIDAQTYPGERSYLDRGNKKPLFLTSFIVKSPGLEWNKYEGWTAGGGQNTVKVNGKKMKLTDFLRLPSEQQDALIQGSSGEQLDETSPESIAKINQITRR
jgi:hypothetical protein